MAEITAKGMAYNHGYEHGYAQGKKDAVKWISVEERLPEEFVSVLVYMPEERPLPPVHEGFLAREGMWYANHFDREPLEITHWMPFPEPPADGGNDG